MGKILRISLKLNFIRNALGCYGLTQRQYLLEKINDAHKKKELNVKGQSIRTLMIIQGRLERLEANRMHFKWEVT